MKTLEDNSDNAPRWNYSQNQSYDRGFASHSAELSATTSQEIDACNQQPVSSEPTTLVYCPNCASLLMTPIQQLSQIQPNLHCGAISTPIPTSQSASDDSGNLVSHLLPDDLAIAANASNK